MRARLTLRVTTNKVPFVLSALPLHFRNDSHSFLPSLVDRNGTS